MTQSCPTEPVVTIGLGARVDAGNIADVKAGTHVNVLDGDSVLDARIIASADIGDGGCGDYGPDVAANICVAADLPSDLVTVPDLPTLDCLDLPDVCGVLDHPC